MAITGTYNLAADPIWRQLPLQEVYLECDTSTAPVTINLFPVSDLQRFWNVKIYVTDISNNAGTNPITINAGFSGLPLVQDTINRQGYNNFNIDYNGGDAVLMVVTENKWAVFSQTVLSQTGLNYRGAWDANSNTPTLTSSIGIAGDYYIVSIAGNTNLNGVIDWQVGDWAIFEGVTSEWQKIDNHDVQAYNTIQEEGAALPQRSIIDFQGGGVTASDNGSNTVVTIPIQPAYATIQEEGSSLTQQPIIDFQGSGVTATNGSGKTIVTVPIQPAYATIQEEGVPLPQRSIIDFQGSGVTATDNGAKTIVTVPIQPAYSTIQEEGSSLTQQPIIDFQGSGVTATNGSGKTIVTVPIQPAYATIQEEGSSLTQQPIIDFQGSGVTATNGSGKTIVTVPIQPAYATIQEEGVSLPQRNTIDFQGGGVTASDNGSKTIVTVNGVIPTNAYGLFAQTATSTGVSGIAEQSIVGTGVGTLSVPPNAFSIGDSFTCALDGTLSSLSSATLHIHVRTTAGVLLADTGIINMAAATNKPWVLTLYFTVRAIGGAGVASISSGGLFSYIRNGGTNFEGYVLSNINNIDFNTTITNALDVSAQWNTASVSNVIRSTNFVLTKIY
jgi:hypothetical protein